MFHDWDSFYLLIGSGAAALIGLLFVVATLTTNLDQGDVSRGTRFFMTPTVFHFAVVLVISAVALAPGLTRPMVGAIVGASALVGLAYSSWAAAQIRKSPSELTHWSDFWFYGAAAAACHLALGTTAVMVLAGAPYAAHGVALALLVILLLGIRNAWDLVTWLAPRAHKG